jgi:N-acetylmuramoyl-L-alanine amidase
VSAGSLSETVSSNYIFYLQQGRRVLPRVSVHFQSYLPLIDLLVLMDLPYSESASAGFVQVTVGNHVLRLTRDRNVVLVDDTPVVLSVPVVHFENRWLVPPEFLGRALNRVLTEKITMAGSGTRFCLGDLHFNRITARAVGSDQGSRVVVHMTNPVEAEIRKEQNKMIFSFGIAPVDPAREDFQYRDPLINGVVFEEGTAAGQLVVYLSDKALQTRVAYIPDQGVYLLEVNPSGQAKASDDERPLSSESAFPPLVAGKRGRHITIDPGHGGRDRGALIKGNLYEKEISLLIARRLRWVLQTQLGATVLLTRNEDQTVSLEERAQIANAARSDLLVSVHVGSWSHARESKSYVYVTKMVKPNRFPDGKEEVEVLDSTKVNFLPWDRAQWWSMNRSVQLAGLVQVELNRTVNGGDLNLAYRRAPLKMLSSLAMPAVLVEIGNVQEPGFQEKISDAQFQNTITSSIFVAIGKYYSSVAGY